MHLGHVYLVEDNESLRANLRDLLVFAGYRVREWSNAQDFLNDLPNDAPAVVVSDMLMPGMSGVEMHKDLIQRGRMMPVIYISGESSVPQSIEAMKLGALDFLVKPFSREELLRVVAQGIEKDAQLMRSMIEKSRFNESLRQLSPRECQVHTLLLKGMNNAEIMTQLHISLPTAKQYKSEVMRKLGVRSLAQLIELSGPLRENQS
ncbi:MAG: response regulator [Limnohabitans sp.]|jgi:two-component system response regulator FixJ|uniref:response regulator transcription factor n=1 Tax=Limnohabitans sp. TaxID=1907725 RepID=UPI003BAE2B8D